MNRILIDYEKCTGCRICQMVCSQRFVDGGFNSRAAAIRVMVKGIFEADVPVTCLQCKKPLCSEACPTGAFYRDAVTNAVMINEEKCIGCGKCAEACPFGTLFLHPSRIVPIKCDLCSGNPLCVQHCPNEVLSLKSETVVGEKKRKQLSEKIATRRVNK